MPALESAPTSIFKAPIARREFRAPPLLRRNLPRIEHRQPSVRRFTPLPDRLVSPRDRLTMLISELRQRKSVKQPESIKPHPVVEKSMRYTRLPARDALSNIAKLPLPQPSKTEKKPEIRIRPPTLARVPLREPPRTSSIKTFLRRPIPIREHRGIFEKTPPKLPVTVKNAEAFIKLATEVRINEPISKDEFKTLHPSERFFLKIPKLKEIPRTNKEAVGSVPESRVVAEKNMATPFEVYKRVDTQGRIIPVVRKLHPEALALTLIKETGEPQIVKADNGRDVSHTLAFQVKESGKSKYFRLEETNDLVMRFVEITDKKQIAQVVKKRQEYARKMGILPDRNKLRQNPGLEVKADQKKRDHFFTWHDMLDKISMKSIQTLGKAHIVCDKLLPPEKASLFSKKFIEAYYSEKYEGLSIEQRTKQAYQDTVKELGLEEEIAVATYLITHENIAYSGGKSTAKVTAFYPDSVDQTEPPRVFQPEIADFKSEVFAVDGRVLTLDDDTLPAFPTSHEISPDNGIKLILQPDSI